MRRREFITLLGGAAAWPLAARAQQAGKLPRVGVIAPGRPDAAATTLAIRAVSGLKKGLYDLGYIENQNIELQIRWDEGQTERNAALAIELVNLGVDLIVASGTQATLAAREATRTIPVIAAALGGGDPVDLGLAGSLGRPGGNVTGVVLLTHMLPGKRLQLLKEAVPALSRVALLWNDPRLFSRQDQDYEIAARELRLGLDALEVNRPEAFETAFQAATAAHADAIIVSQGSFFAVYAQRIADLALKHRLPTVSGETGFAQLGGFMNYGPDIVEAWRYAATYVDRILRGAKPGELPMEQAVKFELVINLKTAKALGLTVPPTLLAIADEVIE
jgi:putative tryptophan/tyrosine transport system substrate-binding protein